MAQYFHRIQEINYINHIGAWSRPDLASGLSIIASATTIHRKETITEDTVRLLENYIYWAPKRQWMFGDWEYFYNYAAARLVKVKRILAQKERETGQVPKIITIFDE